MISGSKEAELTLCNFRRRCHHTLFPIRRIPALLLQSMIDHSCPNGLSDVQSLDNIIISTFEINE
jgi:hypothetical protein